MRIVNFNALQAVMVLLPIALPACDRPAPPPEQKPSARENTQTFATTGPEFGDWLKQFVEDIRSGDKTRRRKAAIAYFLSPEEIRFVFPLSGERVAKETEEGRAKATDADIDSFVDTLINDYGGPKAEVKVLEIRNVRQERNKFDDERVTKALKEMPPDAMLIEPKMSVGGDAYFTRVNGRWVCLSKLQWLRD